VYEPKWLNNETRDSDPDPNPGGSLDRRGRTDPGLVQSHPADRERPRIRQ